VIVPVFADGVALMMSGAEPSVWAGEDSEAKVNLYVSVRPAAVV
jgi:hypothetical protein